ncbi:unnamed protein product [Camellia sinensis]
MSHSVTLFLSHAFALLRLSLAFVSIVNGASPPSHTSTTFNPPLEHYPRSNWLNHLSLQLLRSLKCKLMASLKCNEAIDLLKSIDTAVIFGQKLVDPTKIDR